MATSADVSTLILAAAERSTADSFLQLARLTSGQANSSTRALNTARAFSPFGMATVDAVDMTPAWVDPETTYKQLIVAFHRVDQGRWPAKNRIK
jgi:hypothetical protein